MPWRSFSLGRCSPGNICCFRISPCGSSASTQTCTGDIMGANLHGPVKANQTWEGSQDWVGIIATNPPPRVESACHSPVPPPLNLLPAPAQPYLRRQAYCIHYCADLAAHCFWWSSIEVTENPWKWTFLRLSFWKPIAASILNRRWRKGKERTSSSSHFEVSPPLFLALKKVPSVWSIPL